MACRCAWSKASSSCVSSAYTPASRPCLLRESVGLRLVKYLDRAYSSDLDSMRLLIS
jgi:hypothetical protein